MEDILEELLLHSFCFLELGDLLHAEQVCRTWRRIAHDATLWKRMSNFSFIQRALQASDKQRKEVFVRTYKQAQSMWLGQCSVTTLQKSVSPILGVSKEKNLLVSGTSNRLSVWNLDNMTCVDTIEDVYSLEGQLSKRLVALKRGKAIYSSSGHNVVVYNLVSKRRAGVLVGHTSKVSTMNWDNATLLCTGSRDGTVRFWDTRTFSSPIVYTVGDRVRAVKPLPSNTNVTIVAYGAGWLSYYDMRNPQKPFEEFCICDQLLDADEEVTGMKITSNSVMFSVAHTYLYKYCLDTRTTTAFVQDTTDTMSVMTCNESTIMVGYNDGIIRAYNSETMKYLYHLKVARDYTKVITMMFDEGCLAFGLNNGMIGLCDFDKATPRNNANPTALPTSGTAYSSTPVMRHLSTNLT